jgi:hypothetical protein
VASLRVPKTFGLRSAIQILPVQHLQNPTHWGVNCAKTLKTQFHAAAYLRQVGMDANDVKAIPEGLY